LVNAKNSSNIIANIFLILTIISSSSCYFLHPSATKINTETILVPYGNKLGKSTQLLLVIDHSNIFYTKIFVYALEKRDGIWQMIFEPINAVIGRNGFAPTGDKREGDGRTPSGIFTLRQSFGYAQSIITKMPYRQASDDDLWIDDPNSADYNRWVKKDKPKPNAASFEKMKRDDDLYKYGIIIEYNTDPVIKGNGSAIFFHVWGGDDVSTQGCVAVSEENILKILAWLDPKALPIIIMGIKN
jgi:L,D-peptidoglycan transpeptidase YkuD (ErfK/YbiS/YcfS/YnhG family)